MVQSDTPPSQFAPYDSNPLRIPAVALIVLSLLWLAVGVYGVADTIINGPPPLPEDIDPAVAAGQRAGFYFWFVCQLSLGTLTLVGAICLIRLKFYGLAMVGVLAGLVPVCGPCFVLAIPFSVWALVVMLRSEVKALFS